MKEEIPPRREIWSGSNRSWSIPTDPTPKRSLVRERQILINPDGSHPKGNFGWELKRILDSQKSWPWLLVQLVYLQGTLDTSLRPGGRVWGCLGSKLFKPWTSCMRVRSHSHYAMVASHRWMCKRNCMAIAWQIASESIWYPEVLYGFISLIKYSTGGRPEWLSGRASDF